MLDVAKKELAEAHASQKEVREIETKSEAEPPLEKSDGGCRREAICLAGRDDG